MEFVKIELAEQDLDDFLISEDGNYKYDYVNELQKRLKSYLGKTVDVSVGITSSLVDNYEMSDTISLDSVQGVVASLNAFDWLPE